jgi:adenine deaminase
MQSFSISGQLIDIFNRTTYPAKVTVAAGIITAIEKLTEGPQQYILPGFIDAHVHIESSMLLPTTFARMAVAHGTVATVSDPHEIANVCGLEGIQYMIDNSKLSPFKFFFGAPSCVPATGFETAGAIIDSYDTETLLKNPDIWYLSEMMNYPGVLFKDKEVIAKIKAAHRIGKPVDGHAPGLMGDDARNYAAADITTDHECFTLEEAFGKINVGMNIIIREGSAAKNFEALHTLISSHPEKVMLCSDDKHPDELELGHINKLVKRALAKGYNLYNVLTTACINPVNHYHLPVGLLRKGDAADFIIIDNPEDVNVLQTYINGQLVAENGKTLLPYIQAEPINNFTASPKQVQDFAVSAVDSQVNIRVIEAIESQLITNELILPGKVKDGNLVSDVENDMLKIAVVNRYETDAKPAIAFIKNFGLKHGAIASTVAHDCHNIIAVGADDESICKAVNELIKYKGGICVVNNNEAYVLPLPVAGLMSLEDGPEVSAKYTAIDRKAKELGTSLQAPFMTLSFMALLVIPSLKLSDKGLFDGKNFRFTSLTT